MFANNSISCKVYPCDLKYVLLILYTDLRETVDALTRELETTRSQHEDAIEEMRMLDTDQHERTVEKIRRELTARDRQIESLEEQLAKFNDNSLRRMKRGFPCNHTLVKNTHV